MYNRLPEDKPSGSKHVEDIINQNISSEKVHFVGLYCIITRWFKYERDYLCVNKPVTVPVIFEPPCILQCKVQKTRFATAQQAKQIHKFKNIQPCS